MEISQITSIKKNKYNENTKKYIKRLNKAITYTYDYSAQQRYFQVDVPTLRIVVYSGAELANNYDHSPQLGRVIFLVDADENPAPIVFKSYKS